MFAEVDLVPISALQHYLYCPRQCALIHVERVWEDSRDTALGTSMHDRAHRQTAETRPAKSVATSLPIRSLQHGLVGIADIVEFHAEGPFPVEYKKGKPKPHDADRVQLCAQALCLEEMLGEPIPAGALFYGATRRREVVPMTPALRSLTAETAAAVRQMLAQAQLPPALYAKRLCGRCSLQDMCQPRVNGNVTLWIQMMVED